MCDTINTREAPPFDPKTDFVYKVALKIKKGRYVTPVMGHSLYLGRWNKAKEVPETLKKSFWCHGLASALSLHISLKSIMPNVPSSSQYASWHDGAFGVFLSFEDARATSMNTNFTLANGVRMRRVVLKCRVDGKITRTLVMGYLGNHGLLCEKLFPVEEI